MRRVLVSWIGRTDLQASRAETQVGFGPLGQALKSREFDEVVLVSNYPPREGKAYVAWAAPLTSAKVSLRQVELKDPTDFRGIYKAVDPVLREVTAPRKDARKVKLSLHLSPGTPAMGAVWMILGKTRYPAELIQSSPETGVRTAAIPFDIAAEFVDLVPLVTRPADVALEARTAGEVLPAPRFGDIVFRCEAMQKVVERARKVAPRSVSVLIEGESGTGKELLARAIHAASPRAKRAFVAVNCGAIPSELVEAQLFGYTKGAFTDARTDRLGFFRAADGGTLFLDEVGELPLAAQVKLLRALQERAITPVGEKEARPVDVRILTATNRNLAVEVQQRRFREDLFYRLAVAVLWLPPLRERHGDLQSLIDVLLAKANAAGLKEEPRYQEKKLSAAARNRLMNHPWPGNVRELENTLMRATVWAEGSVISEADIETAFFRGSEGVSGLALPEPELTEGFELDALLDEISRKYIARALKQAENKTQAGKLLGLSRQVLDGRMKKLEIEP